MKKLVFAVVIGAIAASPAMAEQQKKKKQKHTPAAATEQSMRAAPSAPANTNEQSANFAKDSLPVFLPSWSMPVYMSVKDKK